MKSREIGSKTVNLGFSLILFQPPILTIWASHLDYLSLRTCRPALPNVRNCCSGKQSPVL